MKRISVKGLALFMTATSARQRTIVKQYKYPQEDEAHARIIYYRETRDIIKAYHVRKHTAEFLTENSDRLLLLSAGNTGATKTRLRNNSRAVMQYAMHFSGKSFNIL